MRARLVFIGRNPENLSGWSSKFYNLDPLPDGRVQATWGKIGTAGQSQVYDRWAADAKLREKLRKGYVYATDAFQHAPSAPPVPALPLEVRVAQATFGAITFERLVSRMAARCFIEAMQIGDTKLYLDDSQQLWAVRKSGDSFAIAHIGARRAA